MAENNKNKKHQQSKRPWDERIVTGQDHYTPEDIARANEEAYSEYWDRLREEGGYSTDDQAVEAAMAKRDEEVEAATAKRDEDAEKYITKTGHSELRLAYNLAKKISDLYYGPQVGDVAEKIRYYEDELKYRLSACRDRLLAPYKERVDSFRLSEHLHKPTEELNKAKKEHQKAIEALRKEEEEYEKAKSFIIETTKRRPEVAATTAVKPSGPQVLTPAEIATQVNASGNGGIPGSYPSLSGSFGPAVTVPGEYNKEPFSSGNPANAKSSPEQSTPDPDSVDKDNTPKDPSEMTKDCVGALTKQVTQLTAELEKLKKTIDDSNRQPDSDPDKEKGKGKRSWLRRLGAAALATIAFAVGSVFGPDSVSKGDNSPQATATSQSAGENISQSGAGNEEDSQSGTPAGEKEDEENTHEGYDRDLDPFFAEGKTAEYNMSNGFDTSGAVEAAQTGWLDDVSKSPEMMAMVMAEAGLNNNPSELDDLLTNSPVDFEQHRELVRQLIENATNVHYETLPAGTVYNTWYTALDENGDPQLVQSEGISHDHDVTLLVMTVQGKDGQEITIKVNSECGQAIITQMYDGVPLFVPYDTPDQPVEPDENTPPTPPENPGTPPETPTPETPPTTPTNETPDNGKDPNPESWQDAGKDDKTDSGQGSSTPAGPGAFENQTSTSDDGAGSAGDRQPGNEAGPEVQAPTIPQNGQQAPAPEQQPAPANEGGSSTNNTTVYDDANGPQSGN